jgi:hypothetical protein
MTRKLKLMLHIDDPARHSSSHSAIVAQRKRPMKTSIVILALAAAAIGAASPALAKATQQANDTALIDGFPISKARADALHECNARIARFRGFYALITPLSMYRSCMAEHGQPE